MIDGASANPELRRSELFCAVELILWSMRLDKRHEYMTNPVQLNRYLAIIIANIPVS